MPTAPRRSAPAANATSFSFATALATGTAYSVTVQTQPPGETCSVASGTGTIGSADVTQVAVTCAAASYHLGGTISGLSASGLVLANGSDTVSPAATPRASRCRPWWPRVPRMP